MSSSPVSVYVGDALAAYGFGEGHPFGPDRLDAFWRGMLERGLDQRVQLCAPRQADDTQILAFHTDAYLQQVKSQSVSGSGYLDAGDTPAFRGMYEAAGTVVGTVLAAVDDLVKGRCRHSFVPIAGLHHASREGAAGFCVFNDCGVAIEVLRRDYGIRRVAYVDIDAHHADGVFYAFESDPDLVFADLHEDGRFLYPGTGFVEETGTGAAEGTKLNVPMPPKADDRVFAQVWESVRGFVDRAEPGFILMQCGADSLAGDPITHLMYSEASHRRAARDLKAIAERHCRGRLLALGGGGYNRDNLARAWTAVVEALLEE